MRVFAERMHLVAILKGKEKSRVGQAFSLVGISSLKLLLNYFLGGMFNNI
jgi:hypothetical protein